MRKVGEFLLASHRNAAVVAFFCTFLPLIHLPGGFLVSIMVGFITLCRGPRSGLFVLVWVALPAISLLYLRRFGVFDILLLRSVLVWMFASVLRKYGSWRLVLEFAVFLGFVAIVGVHLFLGDVHGWWASHLNTYIGEVSKVASWKASVRDTQHLIHRLVPIATGVTTFVILLGSWLSLFLARWWQSVLFRPGELRKEFLQVRLSRGLAVVLVVCCIGIWLKLSFIIDFFPVLLLPFMIGGLSVFHFLVSIKKGLLLLLILMYVGLLFLPFFVVLLLSSTGYFDAWFDFRKRIEVKKGEIL